MKKLRLVQTAILLLIATGFSNAQKFVWEQLADMPQATNWYGSCIDPEGGKAYILGGSGPSESLNLLATNQIYDFSNDQWSSGTNMPETTSSFSSEMINGKIYTFGEFHSPRKLTEVKEYDPVNDSWSTMGELPEIFFSHGSCVYDGLIYLFGGYDTDFNPQKTVRTYDPATESWGELPNMLLADTKPAVCVYDDEIYLFNEKGQKFSPSDSSWTELNTGTNDIIGYAVPIVDENTIFLFGGYRWSAPDNYYEPANSIYAYYPDEDTMMKLDAEMPFKRFTGGHKYQNWFYFFGGHDDASLGSVTNEVWRAAFLDAIDDPYRAVQSFTLQANYPNPFSATTQLNYELAIPGNVQLEIYDCLGKRIFLLSDKKQQPGTYQHTWDASGVQPGIYFCKLKFDGFEQSRKLIKVRTK